MWSNDVGEMMFFHLSLLMKIYRYRNGEYNGISIDWTLIETILIVDHIWLLHILNVNTVPSLLSFFMNLNSSLTAEL